MTHKEEISKLKNNCILSSKNILDSKYKNQNKIIPFLKNEGAFNFSPRVINAMFVKTKDILPILQNKDIKKFDEFCWNIDFKYISTYDIVAPISLVNDKIIPMIIYYLSIFVIKNIIKLGDFKFDYEMIIKKNIIDKNKENILVKIYKELHKIPLNITIINTSSSQLNKILNEYKKSELNKPLNYLVVVGDTSNINFNKFNSKIIQCSKFINEVFNKIKDLEINYDVYFINSLKKLKIVKKSS